MVTFLAKPLESNQIFAFQWTEVEKKVLTETQVEICEMKYDKKTNQEIITKFSLNSNANIYTSVKATMSGNASKPLVDQGGRPSYLSDVDVVLFESKISHSCFDLQCLSTKQAMQIIVELKQERYKRAKFIANLCCQNISMASNYQKVINELCPTFPSESWLTNFCKSNSIFLKSPDTLEETRRYYCNIQTISTFFNTHWQLLMNKEPRLLFIADESSSVSSKKFKALTLNKKGPCTVTASAKEPHISAVYCYNTTGYKLKPSLRINTFKRFFCKSKFRLDDE